MNNEETKVNQDINGSDTVTQNTEGMDINNQYTEREKQTYARLKKLEAENKALEAQIQSNPVNVAQWQEKIELQVKGYTEEEVSHILKNGGTKALEDPFVMAGIQAKRQERDAQSKAVFDTSSKSDIEKRYSQEEIAGMSAADMEAVLTGRKR